VGGVMIPYKITADYLKSIDLFRVRPRQRRERYIGQRHESKQAAISKAEAKRKRRMENRKINNDIEV